MTDQLLNHAAIRFDGGANWQILSKYLTADATSDGLAGWYFFERNEARTAYLIDDSKPRQLLTQRNSFIIDEDTPETFHIPGSKNDFYIIQSLSKTVTITDSDARNHVFFASDVKIRDVVHRPNKGGYKHIEIEVLNEEGQGHWLILRRDLNESDGDTHQFIFSIGDTGGAWISEQAFITAYANKATPLTIFPPDLTAPSLLVGASNQVTVTWEMLGVGAEDTAEGRITFSDFQGAAGAFHRDGQAVTSFTSGEVADGRITYHALQDGLKTLSFTASYSKQGGAHISEARYELVIRDVDDFSDFHRLVTRALPGGGQSTTWQNEVWNPTTQQHDIYDINFDGPTVILLDHNAAKALTPFLLNQALIGGDDIYHIRQTQIGGTFQERVGDNQVVFDAGFTAYNVTLSVALFKDGNWWRELAIEAPNADPEGEDVVLVFRGLIQNQNDTSLPFTFRISSDGPAMTAAEFVAAHGTGFGPIELGEQGFAVGDVAYPLSPDDFGIEVANLGDDIVTVTITDQPDGTGFYRGGTKVTSFTTTQLSAGQITYDKGGVSGFHNITFTVQTMGSFSQRSSTLEVADTSYPEDGFLRFAWDSNKFVHDWHLFTLHEDGGPNGDDSYHITRHFDFGASNVIIIDEHIPFDGGGTVELLQAGGGSDVFHIKPIEKDVTIAAKTSGKGYIVFHHSFTAQTVKVQTDDHGETHLIIETPAKSAPDDILTLRVTGGTTFQIDEDGPSYDAAAFANRYQDGFGPIMLDDEASVTVGEGGLVSLSLAGLGITNPRDDDLTFTVTDDGAGTVERGGVIVTSFTSDELAAGEVRYRHDASEAPETNLALTITDPFGSTMSHQVTVAVTPVNDSPELALSGGVSATFNAQNDAANILTGEVTISDPDHNLNQLRLTLGSKDSAITFNISGPSQYIQVGDYGVLTIFNHGSDSEGARFSWQYDFQAADKDVDEGTANRFAALQALPAGAVARDTFTISVSDGALTAQQEVTFNVTAIDDPYEVTSHFRFIEGIETDGMIGQVEARDPDGGANSGPFFYRLITIRQGDDQDSSQSAYDDVSSLYHLDATTGVLTFIGDRIDPDVNANRERIYLEIAIHDSASLDAASEIERITHHSDIININEGNPIISYRDQITLDEGATTPMILDNRYLKGSDLDADPTLGVIYRIIDTGGAVIRRAGEERGPDHAYDAFTQRDIDTGTISILFTETGTLILEVDDGQGDYPDVNTAAFGGVPKQTQRLEIDLVFRTIDDLDGEPTTGGNEIDRTDEEVGRVIDTGDDNDVIYDTGGDDVIRPGKGDDRVYLDASHDNPDDPDNPLMVNDDIDIYVYQFGAYDNGSTAIDGSDHVTGFQRGIDQFKLLAYQEGSTAPPPNKEAFFSFAEGTDKESHSDDLILISPRIPFDGAAFIRDFSAGVYRSENNEDYISFAGIVLHFTAGSAYSHGRVSMPYMIIEFDEPVPYQEFKAIVGDKYNGGHNVITDFSLLDDLLGGDASFAYEVV